MERRVLLSIFLAFLVLYVWQALFVKPVPKPIGASAPASVAGTPAGPPASPASPAVPSPESKPSARPAAPSAKTLVGDPGERDVRVETRDVIAVFTNRGARIKSWRLKHFLDQNKEPL